MTVSAQHIPEAPGAFARDFASVARARADRPALIAAESGRVLSYAVLDSLIGRLGSMLAARTEGAEHRVVVSALPNSLEALVLFLAALRAGVDFAPINPEASAAEAAQLTRLVRPVLCVVPNGDGLAATFRDLGVSAMEVPLDGAFDWIGGGELADFTPLRVSRLYLSTSGSTGEPKALVIDGDRLWESGKAFIGNHGFVDASARFLNCLPMHYLAGIYNLGLIPLSIGGSVVVGEAFSGRCLLHLWRNVSRHRVNVLWLVPTILRSLLAIGRRNGFDDTCAAVRAAFLGTAPIDLATKEAFESVFGIPVLENFALSETVFLTSETMDTRVRRRPSSVGEILPDVRLRLAPCGDEDEDGADVREIQVRTPYLFLGYLREDGSLDLPLTDDGYFRTGDVGHLEGERTLALDGRIRDIVKKGGVLIALREIEREAEAHDSVAEAAAVPVDHPMLGEDFVLYIRCGSDAGEGGEAARIAALEAWLKKRLSPQKQPGAIRCCADFPRTASGKIRKHLLVPGGDALGGLARRLRPLQSTQ